MREGWGRWGVGEWGGWSGGEEGGLFWVPWVRPAASAWLWLIGWAHNTQARNKGFLSTYLPAVLARRADGTGPSSWPGVSTEESDFGPPTSRPVPSACTAAD